MRKDYRKENIKGFTLIELLVVVLIIAILAAVAVPQYQLAKDKTKVKAHFPIIRAIVNAENFYRLEHGDYTYNWEELGLEIPHITLSSDKSKMYVKDGGVYELNSVGSYSNVRFNPGYPTMTIYAAFPTSRWLCYPGSTARGKRVCKSLGCSAEEVETTNCVIKPYL